MRILALLSLSLLSILGVLGQHPHCGREAGGKLCEGKLCCSKHGFCGTNPDYCTNGCQSKCDSGGGSGGGGQEQPHCGRQAGGKLCEGKLCCSKHGFCGTNPDYCTNGCQSKCDSGGGSGGGGQEQPHCGRQAGGKLCEGKLCCSKHGFCGTNPDYCTNGCQSKCDSGGGSGGGGQEQPHCGRKAGGKLCEGKLCCSKHGFCGTNPDYCTNGCQSKCDSGGGSGGGGQEQPHCGRKAGGKLCEGKLCCSKHGFCGTNPDYCTNGCQSKCDSGGGSGGGSPTTPLHTHSGGGGNISSLISETMFNHHMLKHRNNEACLAKGFYTYEAFITAAKAFPGFGTTGDDHTKKREIAAFMAQTSHETSGWWSGAPGGPYEWGYCHVREQKKSAYCSINQQYPCVRGKEYYGRGPIQLSYNYNYGQAGKALGINLLANPDEVAENVNIAFKTALWFWMTPQPPKPSCHDVITGRWNPSATNKEAHQVPGYGVITNIINGAIECGKKKILPQEKNRIEFYKKYCQFMGVEHGNHLGCSYQRSF